MTAQVSLAMCILETDKTKLQYREGMTTVTIQLAGKDFATAAGLYNNRFCTFFLHSFDFPTAPKIKLDNTEKAS